MPQLPILWPPENLPRMHDDSDFCLQDLFLFNPISHGIFFSWPPRGGGGGWNPPPLVKMHLEVSEANSFLHSHWYIYKELRSKRICS